MSQKELNMRQRRWVDLIKDYDCITDYYPGKANMVVNALSRKNWIKREESSNEDKREMIKLRRMNTQLSLGPEESLIA